MLCFMARGSTHLTSKNLQELIKNLQVFYKCPSCDGGYRLNDITFLGKVDNHCFMQLNCHHCSLPVLATVFLTEDNQVDPKSIPNRPTKRRKAAKTDLKAGEKARFARMEPITSAEIADFHLQISAYKGNFVDKASPARKRNK